MTESEKGQNLGRGFFGLLPSLALSLCARGHSSQHEKAELPTLEQLAECEMYT